MGKSMTIEEYNMLSKLQKGLVRKYQGQGYEYIGWFWTRSVRIHRQNFRSEYESFKQINVTNKQGDKITFLFGKN